MLDFLNPNNDPGGLPGLPDAQPQAAQPSPAAIIEMARAMREHKEKEQAATKESSLPAMYDAEGRKLGPRGVVTVLRNKMAAARAAGDLAQVRDIEAALAVAEADFAAWLEKSGDDPRTFSERVLSRGGQRQAQATPPREAEQVKGDRP